MGFWGVIYAIIFLPAALLCLATRDYLAIGIIMMLKWTLFILPVRSIFPFGNEPLYFTAVSCIAIICLYVFARHMIAARLIIAILSLTIMASYAGLGLHFLNLHQSMIVADIGGYLQILVLYGGAGGKFLRVLYTNSPLGGGIGRFHHSRGGHTWSLFKRHDNHKAAHSRNNKFVRKP